MLVQIFGKYIKIMLRFCRYFQLLAHSREIVTVGFEQRFNFVSSCSNALRATACCSNYLVLPILRYRTELLTLNNHFLLFLLLGLSTMLVQMFGKHIEDFA